MTPLGRHIRPTCNKVFVFCLFSSQSLDNKPSSRTCQWSTVSHSVCFLDLTTLFPFRFRHLCHVKNLFNQTVVPVRVQSLYSMASSSAHDFCLQEANTLSFVHLLMSRAWRHSGVTHVPHVTRLTRDTSIKKIMCGSKILCVFSWLWGCEGSGTIFMTCACAVGLCGNGLPGMRGTWGVVWRSAHVPSILFTWLRRVNAWTPSAHASNYQALLSIKLCEKCRFNSCVRVFFIPMGSRVKSCPNMGICDVNKSHGPNTQFWLVEKIFAALWLVTPQRGHIHYSGTKRCTMN